MRQQYGKLRKHLEDNILLLDGAMGTELKKYEPVAADYPDNHLEFNDGLCITHPEWVQSIYAQYLDAGCDCITTNTFGSNTIKLGEYGMSKDTEKINENSTRLAREMADIYADTTGRLRYVMGSMGPSGYLPSIVHDSNEISLDTLENAFYRQAQGLITGGGVDGIVLETSVDLLELKIMITAVKKVSDTVPIISNITLAQEGRMLLGTPTEAAYCTISAMGIDVFGINCSTGPREMQESIQWLDENSDHPILVVPNAGIPDVDNDGVFPLQAAEMSEIFARLLRKHHKTIRIIGGCCGTTPTHIRMLRELVDATIPISIV